MTNILNCFSKYLIKFVQVFILISTLFLFITDVDVYSQSRNVIPTSEAICGGSCPIIDSEFEADRESIANFIISLARFLTFISGALAVLYIVWGAFLIVTDFGDGTRSKNGWNSVRSSIIGLIVVIGAYTAVAFIGSLLIGTDLSDVILSN